jgi:hypothetical protein
MNDAVVQNNATPQPKKSAGFTFAPGTKPLPDYTIKRGLGEGGFGEVYFAHSEAGKEVALKVIRRHLDIELRGVSQCLNLKHPNLVALYDVRVDAEGNHWIVMEYVAGERLCDALVRHPRGLPLDEALSWLRGVAAGVEYLHQNGIVHRDLKPANLFRENGVVKIGDYGLSKFISASRRSGHTESVGTVHYMAPEIAGGRYGKEIDVYSLGVILCEMLTGRVPFDGESVGEILMKHLSSEPDLSGLAEPYRGAIAAALHKDPAQRPALGDYVRCVTGGAPLPTPPVIAPRPIAAPVAPFPPRKQEPAATMPHPSSATSANGQQAFVWLFTAAAIAVGLLVAMYFVRHSVDSASVAVPEMVGAPAPNLLPAPTVVQHQPTMIHSTPTWGLSILSLGVLGVVFASVWAMRRMIAGPARDSRIAADDPVIAAPPTWRTFATDLTGSWLVLFVTSAIISRLLLLIQGGKPEFEQIVWAAATTFLAAALIALVEKWPGEAERRRHGRRLRSSLIGAVVGTASFFLADYMKVAFPTEYSLSSIVGVDVWPECYVDGRPTWLAFAGYFGLVFFVLDWQRVFDPRRKQAWRLGDTAVAVFWAYLIHLVFPFPQLWGILVIAGTYLSLPFVFPIAENARVRRVPAGRPS